MPSTPTTFAGAMLFLVASLVLALGALLLLYWGLDTTFVSAYRRRRQLVSRVVGILVLLALALFWLSQPFAQGAV